MSLGGKDQDSGLDQRGSLREGREDTEHRGNRAFMDEGARQRKGKGRVIKKVRDPGAPGLPSARKGAEQGTRCSLARSPGVRGLLEPDRRALLPIGE